MISRIVEAVQNLVRKNPSWRMEPLPDRVATAIVKTVLSTYETVITQQYTMARDHLESSRGSEYKDHTIKRLTTESIQQGLANGYVPASLPTEELLYTSFLRPGQQFTEEDPGWDTVLIRLTLPLRRAYLDKPYTLQPKADK